MEQLQEEYRDAIQNEAREQDPNWFLDAQDRLSWNTFSYVPEAHFTHAFEQALAEEFNGELVPDGGRYTETVYAWHDPDTDTLLYHTELNDEYADPFFETRDEAYDFLEKHVEQHDHEDYDGLSLKKLRGKKVGDAVDVLTDQAGIQDFVPDGGQPVKEEIYVWYDPQLNAIIQDEVTPGLYAGIFDQEEEAIHFMEEHREDPDQTSDRLELYRAEWEKIGSEDNILED